MMRLDFILVLSVKTFELSSQFFYVALPLFFLQKFFPSLITVISNLSISMGRSEIWDIFFTRFNLSSV